MYVTCRTLAQAKAALQAGADGVYLDFLALSGLGAAVRELREGGAQCVGIALPRITKPGEEKIDQFIGRLAPDALLLRSLGQLNRHSNRPAATERSGEQVRQPLLIGDSSLNVANTLSALELLGRGIDAWTPAFDLDAAQLMSLLDSPVGRRVEVVIHHPVPLFHMEHCVIAARLSDGKDYRDCGRPCESHLVSLRDRKGSELPVEADIGCRNTVLSAQPQSAIRILPRLLSLPIRRFRIELLRESPDLTREIVAGYREHIHQRSTSAELRNHLRDRGVSIVEGSLRVLG